MWLVLNEVSFCNYMSLSRVVAPATNDSVRFGSGSGKIFGTRPDPVSQPVPEPLGSGSYPGRSGNGSGNGNII